MFIPMLNMQLFFAIPKILKRGIVISGHPDHKGRSYGTVTIAAPIEINGQRVIVGVVVKQAGKNRYKTHRVLLPDGKELRGDNKKDTGSTVARHALPKEDQRSAIDPVSNTSIPQNPEMSTDSGEKVAENIEAVDGSSRSALPKTREARERKLKRAQAHQKQVKERKRVERSAAERIAEARRGEQQTVGASPRPTEETISRRGYTDAEANAARGLVGDFDILPPSVRRSIVELIRSGEKSGASKNIIEYVNRQIDQGKLKDASTKKAPIWFTSRGLQLPKLVQTIIDANNSIAEKTKKSTDSGEKVSENSGAKRSALSKPSGDEMIERAVMRGYGDKSGANSQTSEKAKEEKPKAKPKRTAVQVAKENAERRAAVEMAQVEEKAARKISKRRNNFEKSLINFLKQKNNFKKRKKFSKTTLQNGKSVI